MFYPFFKKTSWSNSLLIPLFLILYACFACHSPIYHLYHLYHLDHLYSDHHRRHTLSLSRFFEAVNVDLAPKRVREMLGIPKGGGDVAISFEQFMLINAQLSELKEFDDLWEKYSASFALGASFFVEYAAHTKITLCVL